MTSVPDSPPTTTAHITIPPELRQDVETLWEYHDMHHELQPADIGIGVGSHDPGVAMIAVHLFRQRMFPRLAFTGANAPTTIDRFPRGEAVHYREYAIEHGVPADRILIETRATNTGQNIEYTRQLLTEHGIHVRSVILMSRPYQQRRAYATCRKLWPDVHVQCASHPLALDDYVTMIGDANRVINMLVGDTQRIDLYAESGFAIPQEMPEKVRIAYQSLVRAGCIARIL